MNAGTFDRRLMANLIAIVLLVVAQFGAAVHAFEHDLDTPQVKVCGTCITAAQLGTACTGSLFECNLAIVPHEHVDVFEPSLLSVARLCPQSRGPPSPLSFD